MRVYIETLGCPKNVNDSESAAGLFKEKGHIVTESAEDAEAVIVNTCGFIDDAKRESISKIFELNCTKNKDAVLVVTGCLPQLYKDRIFRQLPEADIIVGVNDYADLPEIIQSHKNKRIKRFSEASKEYKEMPARHFSGKPYSTTLKIAEGCGNKCSYCVIPAIRGDYRSRRIENILAEAESLGALGCKEFIIVAQDVTAYGGDIYGKYELPALLKRLCRIEGISWIRLMYCYEDRITDELIKTMKEEEKICKYIDMPIQHCSDKILTAMNRRSTKDSIMSTIDKLRRAMPDIHIRTSLITGFPGESKEDFSELLDFVEDVRFDRLGVFAYSKEAETGAAALKPQIRQDVKEARKNSVMLRQLEISRTGNMKKIGGIYKVIVESFDGEAYYGRTEYDAPEIDNSVIFTSVNKLSAGDMARVKITDAFDYDLAGREV